MNRNLFAFAFASFAALLAAPAFAGFDVSYHEGSRADVRAWCSIEDGVLSDREDYSMCVSANVPGTTFTCDDGGDCIRTGYDLIETGDVIPLPGVTVAPTSDVLPTASQSLPGKLYTPLPYSGFGGLDLVE